MIDTECNDVQPDEDYRGGYNCNHRGSELLGICAVCHEPLPDCRHLNKHMLTQGQGAQVECTDCGAYLYTLQP